jgi:hypothetical protein
MVDCIAAPLNREHYDPNMPYIQTLHIAYLRAARAGSVSTQNQRKMSMKTNKGFKMRRCGCGHPWQTIQFCLSFCIHVYIFLSSTLLYNCNVSRGTSTLESLRTKRKSTKVRK